MNLAHLGSTFKLFYDVNSVCQDLQVCCDYQLKNMRRIFCAHDVTYQSLGIHTGWHDMCCRQHRGQTPYLSFAGICHLQGASWTSLFWGQFRPWNAVRSIACAVRSMINCDCYKNATNKTMKCSCLQWRNAFPSYEIWSLYDFRSSSCFSLSTTFVEVLMQLFGLLTWTVYTVHSSFLVGQQSSTIIIRTCAGGELLLKMENFD